MHSHVHVSLCYADTLLLDLTVDQLQETVAGLQSTIASLTSRVGRLEYFEEKVVTLE